MFMREFYFTRHLNNLNRISTLYTRVILEFYEE